MLFGLGMADGSLDSPYCHWIQTLPPGKYLIVVYICVFVHRPSILVSDHDRPVYIWLFCFVYCCVFGPRHINYCILLSSNPGMAAGSSSLSWHYQIQALSPCEWFIVVFYYYLGSRHNHFGSSLLLGAEAVDCWLFESLDVQYWQYWRAWLLGRKYQVELSLPERCFDCCCTQRCCE